MADYLAQYTDQQVEEFAKKIAKVYAQAAKEIQEKYDDYAAKYAVKDQKKFADYLAGKITLEKYQSWLKGQVFIGKQWEQKVKDITNIYLNADKKAYELLSDTDESVFTEAANHSAYEIEQGIDGAISFDLFDKETVKRLIKDNPKMLPEWKIDKPKDYIWNEERVQNAVSQAIIQGEKIPDIAKRLGKELATSNAKKMVLFARTATNGAQNAGRIQRMHETADMELDVRKEWIAANDTRVRDTHRALNGQICKEGEKFKVGTQEIEYPGDPTAAPALVYNCRCSIGFVYPKYNKAEKGLYYIGEDGQKHEVTDMTYKEWTAAKEKEKADKEAAEKAAQQAAQAAQAAQTSVKPQTNPNEVEGIPIEIIKKKAEDFTSWDIVHQLHSLSLHSDAAELVDLQGEYFKTNGYLANMMADYKDGNLDKAIADKLEKLIALSIQKTDNIQQHMDAFNAVQGKKVTEFKKEINSVNSKLSTEFANALKQVAVDYGIQPKEAFEYYKEQQLFKEDAEKLDKIVGTYLEKKAAGETHEVKKKKVPDEELHKTFSGIWKEDVTYADWPNKKDKIQAKKDYFEQQIAIADSNGDADKLAKFKGLLADLEEFEKNGKKYSKLLQKEQPKIVYDPKGNLQILTEERIKNIKQFYDRYEADKHYRPYLDSIWDNITDEEKYAIWEYTRNSHPINKSLSGYHDTWERYGFLGLENTDWGHEDKWRDLPKLFEKFGEHGHAAYKKVISALTKAINKSEFQDDHILVRGSSNDGLAGLFEGNIISFDTAKTLLDSDDPKDFETVKKIVVGQTFQNHAFTSTAIASDSGFDDNVKYKIFAPKGTKGIYAEPQSYWAGDSSHSQQSFFHKKGEKLSDIGTEAEVILQRGTSFRVRDITRDARGHIEIELEIVEQPDYFQYGDEDTYNDGKTRHPS